MNDSLLRIGKIVAGAVGMLAVLGGTVIGVINLDPARLFARGLRPWGFVVLYGVVFLFPYLLTSSLIQPGEAVFAPESSDGVMGSYGTQDAISRRYRRHMLAVFAGVIFTGACIAISIVRN